MTNKIRYVPYRISGMKVKTFDITSDFLEVWKLINEGEAQGYIVGPMVSIKSGVLNSDIRELPWKEVDEQIGMRVYRVLRRKLGRTRIGTDEYREPTVRDVVDLFAIAAGRGGLALRNYGPQSDVVTREVFRRAGIELPEVKKVY